ncbi:MAG: class I SAM-dependent methyltransferase [Simkaniaceae bacterium]|nr:class I SAM-dependent methyltransferase [Simkaniaceae bacterium]
MCIMSDQRLTCVSDHVYEIQNSLYLSVTKAAELSVTEAVKPHFKRVPIFSDRRIAGQLRFTIVPYAKPSDFEQARCPLVRVSDEELKASVVPRHIRGNLSVGTRIFTVTELTKIKKEIILKCNHPSSLVVDFADTAEVPGRALDLGCGIGVNSEILLKKGWEVIAFDNSPEVLEVYQKNCLDVSSHFVCSQADITEIVLPDSVNLAVAVDILPYINPTEVAPLLSKIHRALLPGGRLIGSLLIDAKESLSTTLLRGIGAHFYRIDSAPASLLQQAGFKVERCSWRYDTIGVEPGFVEFMATKTSE